MVSATTNLSPSFYKGNQGRIFIGVHTMEAPEVGTTAEAVARYFHEKATKASAHWCVDDNSRVRCVEDEDSAWTMPPCNHYSLNVEMAGYAGQSAKQWDDQYSLDTMNNAALCVAEWCKKYNVPVRHLDDKQIAAQNKGLVGHVDVNRVFHGSTHTDPGPNFPWPRFIGFVHVHLDKLNATKPKPAPAPAHPTPVSGSAKPNCEPLQRAVRIKADNKWGASTDKNCSALIAATLYGKTKFPYGVPFTQAVVGVKRDGLWGTGSKNALKTTVLNAQLALHAMGFNPGANDGNWGPNTNTAYEAARKACHI